MVQATDTAQIGMRRGLRGRTIKHKPVKRTRTDANIQLCRKAPRKHFECQPLCKSSVLTSLDWLSPSFRLTHLAKSSLVRSATPESLPHVSQSQLPALVASWRLLAVAKQKYSTNPESGLSDDLRHPNSCQPTAKVHQHTPQITPKHLYAEVRCAQKASY